MLNQYLTVRIAMTKKNINGMNLNITTPNFHYLSEQSKNIGKELYSNQPLIFTGRFIPQRAGPKKLVAKLVYRESKQAVQCETQVMQVKEKVLPGKPAIAILTENGYSLIGDLEGPFFGVNNGRLAWNPKTQELICLGSRTKGYIYNLEKKSLPKQFSHSVKTVESIKWNKDLEHFIAVGERGGIYLSSDGRDWVSIWLPITANLKDVSWSASLQRYVIVGEKGTLKTSTNGQEWASHEISTQYHLKGVTRSEELKKYVVIYEDQTNKKCGVLTSEEGLTWKDHPGVTSFTANAQSISWSAPNKIFVAVGNQRTILNSDDGLVWSEKQLNKHRTFMALTINFDLTKVIYSRSLNAFFAIGVGDDFILRYSHDGQQWSHLFDQRNWSFDSKGALFDILSVRIFK